MKINVTQVLKNYDGTDIQNHGQPYTLRNAFVICLNANFPNEILSAEDKNKSYQISNKLFKTDEVELTLDDRSFLKERAGKYLTALIQGRVWDILEDKNEDEESTKEDVAK